MESLNMPGPDGNCSADEPNKGIVKDARAFIDVKLLPRFVTTTFPDKSSATLANYQGNPAILDQLKLIASMLKNYKLNRILHVMLVGTQGTDLLHLGQCIAGEAHVPLICVPTPLLRSATSVRRIYKVARRYSKRFGSAIVFLDRFDVTLPDNAYDQLLKQLGPPYPHKHRVLTIGATTNSKSILEALTRPGRLEWKITV